MGSTANQGNVATPNTVVPAGTAAGDRLMLVLSLNDATRTVGDPTGVTGWTLVDSATSGHDADHRLHEGRRGGRRREDGAVHDGRGRQVHADGRRRTPATCWRRRSRRPRRRSSGPATPPRPLEAGAGDWAVSYWADKSSATTAFTLPGGVTQRQAICGANAGRICSVLADSNGGVSAGPYGGLTATADAASSNATMWTILLRQAT